MPLDNKYLKLEIIETLRHIPFDLTPADASKYAYDTKISIYDAKCGGCGFNRIEVGKEVFHSPEEAISFSTGSGHPISRMCEYPADVVESSNGVEYPDINMIITNTCRFWDDKKIEATDG